MLTWQDCGSCGWGSCRGGFGEQTPGDAPCWTVPASSQIDCVLAHAEPISDVGSTRIAMGGISCVYLGILPSQRPENKNIQC